MVYTLLIASVVLTCCFSFEMFDPFENVCAHWIPSMILRVCIIIAAVSVYKSQVAVQIPKSELVRAALFRTLINKRTTLSNRIIGMCLIMARLI